MENGKSSWLFAVVVMSMAIVAERAIANHNILLFVVMVGFVLLALSADIVLQMMLMNACHRLSKSDHSGQGY